MASKHELTTDSPIKKFSEALAEFVFHPDYYKGRWFVEWPGHGRKICKNYHTANAWSKYIRRNFDFAYTTIGRADPLPGFPKSI